MTEEFTLVLNQREYCAVRLALEKFEFMSTSFGAYKTLGEIRGELDLDEDELKTLHGVLERFDSFLG
jgi:hypothetical protein